MQAGGSYADAAEWPKAVANRLASAVRSAETIPLFSLD